MIFFFSFYYTQHLKKKKCYLNVQESDVRLQGHQRTNWNGLNFNRFLLFSCRHALNSWQKFTSRCDLHSSTKVESQSLTFWLLDKTSLRSCGQAVARSERRLPALLIRLAKPFFPDMWPVLVEEMCLGDHAIVVFCRF